MRYATFERDGRVSWGVVQSVGVLDLPAAAAAAGLAGWPETLLAFIQAGPAWWERAGQLAAAAGSASLLPLSGVRLLAPVPQPLRNVFALGLNYAEHAAEGGHNAPDAPIYFTKATTAVIGPEEPIIADPSVSQRLDWEVELGVILGTGGRRISEADALDHVFGYTVIHDVSARDLQFARSGQWFLGKSFDTGCPMGPWIVSADEIGDPQNLDLSRDPRQRRGKAALQHAPHDLSGSQDSGGPLQRAHAASRRHYLHRHAQRDRWLARATGVPPTGRCHRGGGSRHWPPPQPGRRPLAINELLTA